MFCFRDLDSGTLARDDLIFQIGRLRLFLTVFWLCRLFGRGVQLYCIGVLDCLGVPWLDKKRRILEMFYLEYSVYFLIGFWLFGKNSGLFGFVRLCSGYEVGDRWRQINDCPLVGSSLSMSALKMQSSFQSCWGKLEWVLE